MASLPGCASAEQESQKFMSTPRNVFSFILNAVCGEVECCKNAVKMGINI